MAKWYTISAKFTEEEKQVLDIMKEVYGWSYYQSLRNSLNLTSRIFSMNEYYLTVDSKILKKVNKITKKYMTLADKEIKEMLKKIPKEIQDSEYEKIFNDKTKILSQYDKIFVKRKPGRPKKKKSPGRPKDSGYKKS